MWLVDLFECMMMHGLTNPKFNKMYSLSLRVMVYPGALHCPAVPLQCHCVCTTSVE
jgi:hypothetical protein